MAAKPDTAPTAAAVMGSQAGKSGISFQPRRPRVQPAAPQLPGGLDGLSQKKAQHRNGGNAGDAKVHMVTSHFMLCADGAECTGNDTEAQIVRIAG